MRIYYEKGVEHISNDFDTTFVFISAIRDKLYSRLSLFFCGYIKGGGWAGLLAVKAWRADSTFLHDGAKLTSNDNATLSNDEAALIRNDNTALSNDEVALTRNDNTALSNDEVALTRNDNSTST